MASTPANPEQLIEVVLDGNSPALEIVMNASFSSPEFAARTSPSRTWTAS